MSGPAETWRGEVRPEWVDRNGHFNVGYYMVAFDLATTRFIDHCGLDDAHRARHRIATFTVESHATYERELLAGDPFVITTQLLAWSDKKIHYFHRMYHGAAGHLAATNELLSLHVDAERRRAAALAPEIARRLEAVAAAQGDLPWPPQAGRVIAVGARRPATDPASVSLYGEAE